MEVFLNKNLKWVSYLVVDHDNETFIEKLILIKPGFLQGVLGTRFGSLEFQIGSLESEKIIIGSLDSEKIGSLELEKSGPTSPYQVPNIFL